MKKIVLLDTSAIMYRAFYANMNFRTKDEPTGAVYGFTNMLLSIIKEFSPDYICAAQDVKRATLKRSAIFEEYKKNRDAVPEDLLKQIPRIEEVLDLFGIKRFKIDGYEADDVMGTIAKKFSKDGYKIYIVTGDKDLAQLVDENINIALMGKGDDGGFKILSTDEDVINHLGVVPKMIPDLFGLIGDSSDGIPGIRKVGEKKAIPMLEKYKNLEGIYENIDSLREISGIGPGLIKNIKEDKKIAFLSRELATIEKNIPLDIEISQISYKIDNVKLLELFKVLGFKALIKRMNLQEEVAENKENSQLGLFNNIPKVEKSNEILFIDNDEKFLSFLNEVKKEEKVFFYTENIGVAFSTSKQNFYVPYGHNLKLGSKYQNYSKEKLNEIFSMDKKFITYDFKNVIKNLYKISTSNIEFDMMLAQHLKTAQTKEGIEILATEEGIEIQSYSDLFGKELKENLDIEVYGKYLCKISSLLQEIYPSLKEDLEEKNLIKNLNLTEIPLIEVLASMEEKGIAIDPKYFEKYSVELASFIDELESKIYEVAGEKFNINSPKQLSEVLFFKLNIPPVKKTKSGYSTDVGVLEYLKDQGEKIAEYILEYRKFAKLKSTYVDALLKVKDKENRIHTTFNQTGTATGRLSSSEPNLQNIPVKTEEGMKIREGFVAKEGYKILGIDYSQIELRVLGEMSRDENLINAYTKNEDLHSLTARKIFGLPKESEVTREERTVAKTINFSVIYGKTPFGLASELKITQGEAKEYIEKYFAEYPKVKEFEQEIVASAEKKGYVETYFGRRRWIDGINSKNKNIKSQGERMAVNTVIQGTAAEIIKKAMISIYNIIKDKNDIDMLLQVHDELIFEVKEEKVEYYKELIENIMRNSVDFKNIHLEVNSAVGKNWAEAK